MVHTPRSRVWDDRNEAENITLEEAAVCLSGRKNASAIVSASLVHTPTGDCGGLIGASQATGVITRKVTVSKS